MVPVELGGSLELLILGHRVSWCPAVSLNCVELATMACDPRSMGAVKQDSLMLCPVLQLLGQVPLEDFKIDFQWLPGEKLWKSRSKMHWRGRSCLLEMRLPRVLRK